METQTKNQSKVAVLSITVFLGSVLSENGSRDGYFNLMFLNLTKVRFGSKSGSKQKKPRRIKIS